MNNPSVHRARQEDVETTGAITALSLNVVDGDAYLVAPLADRQRVSGGYFTSTHGTLSTSTASICYPCSRSGA